MDRSTGHLERNLSALDRQRAYRAVKRRFNADRPFQNLGIELDVTVSGREVISSCRSIVLSSDELVAKRESEDIRRDICRLEEGHHPNIERFVGDFLIINPLHWNMRIVLTQSLDGKMLSVYLGELSAPRTLTHQASESIKKIFPQLISALNFVHEQGMYHGQINPMNIVCQYDEVYLTGFSFHQRLDDVTNIKYRWYYDAPEAQDDNMGSRTFESHSAQDVFSLGLVFTELLAVLLNTPVREMRRALHGNNAFSEPYHQQLPIIEDWFLSSTRPSIGRVPLVQAIYRGLVAFMIHKDPQWRPNTQNLIKILHVRGLALFDWSDMSSHCHLPEELVAGAPSTGWQLGRQEFLWEDNAQTLLQVTPRGVLGRGRTAEVEEVVVYGSATTLARKRVFIARINAPGALRKTGMPAEIDILRSSNHDHIVKVIGCYQEPVGLYSANFFVLLYPSADCDLRIFLEEKCRNSTRSARKKYVRLMRPWFLCLVSGLAYLHYHGIHHEDIKPANIVHRGKVVYFTDFSSSRKIAPGDETSTESPATATRLFAAPEAMHEDGHMLRHGSKTDVYSLGLVFIEMLTVFTGRNIDDLREYVFGDTIGTRQYHRVIHKLVAWFRDSTNYIRLSSIVLSAMLKHERKDRLSAQGVADRVRHLRDFHQLDVCGCKWIRWERAEDVIDNYNFTNTDEDGEFVIV